MYSKAPPNCVPGLILLVALSCLILTREAGGLEFQANLRAWTGPVVTNDLEQQQSDQRYNLRLWQDLSPWLTVFGSYRYTSFRSSTEELPSFNRSSSQPGLGFLYDRPTFSWRFQGFDRSLSSTVDSLNLDVRSIQSNMDWLPSWGPRFLLRLRDERNTADPTVFGRDTETQLLSFAILEERRRHWTARYEFDWTDTRNNLTEFGLQDSSHELRANYDNGWWDRLLSLSVDGRVRRLDRRTEGVANELLDQPVPAIQGLFAVNTAPAVGALEPRPGLIDGDLETPVSPPIDIGGSNTFRNIGLDLGVIRPITQLEIAVDRPSGPGLIWQVWASPDNLNWFQVPAATSSWDGAFLRYLISFPETESPFFKVVNISPNASTGVLVTEIRALVESRISDRQEGSGTDGWLNIRATLIPHERVEFLWVGAARRDIALALGRPNRARDTTDNLGQLRIRLARTLQLRLSYRLTDLEEDQEPVLLRNTTQTAATLEWRPLPTVRVTTIASRRGESEGDQTLRESDTLTFRATTDIFRELRISSQWRYSEIDNPIFGFAQTNQQWSLSFEARPFQSWTLGGSGTFARYDSTGVIALTRRDVFNLQTTWMMTRYLSVTGAWNYGVDNLRDTLWQSYSLSWTPGRKFAATASFSQTDSADTNLTSSTNLTLNYRLNRWAKFWLSLNDSTTDITGISSSETSSYRFGIELNI